MRIQFISHLPLTFSGGGNYVVGAGLYSGLRDLEVPIEWTQVCPQVSSWDSLQSKTRRRLLRRPSDVAQYSRDTLVETAASVREQLSASDRIPLFKGVTPWIGWKPERPYFVYTDVGYATLLDNQGTADQFRAEDLERIFEDEGEFLENATAVFFESDWGKEQTRLKYHLKGDQFHTVGRAGLFSPEDHTNEDHNGPSLLTIAKNFEQKGGDLVAEAFELLHPQYPDLEWHIVGGPPSFPWRKRAGIRYHGFLQPDNENDLLRYRQILRQASLLVHPTREDTNPLVITEAACFGCPTVTVDRFAIPELVSPDRSGILLPWPVTGRQLAGSIENLLQDTSRYQAMRLHALEMARKNGAWEDIGAKALKVIQQCLD